MSKIIDRTHEDDISSSVIETLTELGYSAEELLSGVVIATIKLCQRTINPPQAADEFVDLLGEGLVDEMLGDPNWKIEEED